jgi:MarR family transcriptional regulator, organic hydroperoxide resistance regulator
MDFGPALDFMRSLWRLNHAMELTSGQMERLIGVTAQQRMIIRCIGKRPGLTPSQLAALLHLDRSTISTALNRMERDELLERRCDDRDRRSVTLWLSARGRRLDRPSEQTVESAVERLLAAINRPDLLAAKRVMARLAEQMEAALQIAPSTSKPARSRNSSARHER